MSRAVRAFNLAALILLTLILCLALTFDFPPFASTVDRVGYYYVEHVLADVGAWNAVGAIVWDYRGYDTLGETLVLFTAVIVILMVLRHEVE